MLLIFFLGKNKKIHCVWNYYGTLCHPAASLMVGRCMRKNYQLTIINYQLSIIN